MKETRKIIEKSRKLGAGFTIRDKIDKTLVRLRKKERLLKTKLKKKTLQLIEIQRFIKEYYEQSYINKLNNLEEMRQFLEA